VSDDLLLEGDVLRFDNKSINADSYFWDFGNGTYSEDKSPDNISLSPCGETYTIKLTVKNKSGDSAVYSQTFDILCSGKHPNNGG
jgi:PKD repeat protein